ncbi:MAG TPA: GDSL-type esterase/lipase family protein [Polyangia bacterium]
MSSQCVLRVFAAAALLVGCSSTSSGPSGQGGSAGQSSGGSSSGGGAGTSTSTGGTGHGGSATGGAPSSGGSSAGGTSGLGGQSTGGRIGQGGIASGGTTGSGGGQGGTSKTGGATGSGGASVTGGMGSGGSAATGGTPLTGGSTGGSGGIGSGGASAGGATGKDGGATGGAPGTGGSTGTTHWVGTWSASPYVDSANPPPASLSGSVLRQVAHVSLGGSQIRVQFSNLFGNGSVTIKSAHIAICKATPAVDSTIDVATDKALAFSGTESVTLAQGKEVWSDAIDFTVADQGNISITTAFTSVPSSVCGHSGSRTTSYLQTGSSNVNAASMTSATAFQHWYYISGIDVMADASAKAVVAIGDSITDGRGTDNDKNNRWTDIMAARLQANAATANVATMNQGIGATNLIGSGTGAEGRFARDVLGQSGVKYAIVFDGVNDIGGGKTFADMKAAYDNLISAAHAKGLLIYGATILPFGGNTGSGGYYTTGHESVRQQVNTYIKSGVFDGIIDFDAALTDGGNPPKLQTTYAAWTPGNPAGSTDGLHPGPAGYQKMGASVDLTLFTK